MAKPPPNALEALTDEQRTTYLEAIIDGVRSDHAADLVGKTATWMRALRKRDKEWDAAFWQARRQSKEDYPDELRATARELALAGNVSLLLMELATYSEDHRHLRRDRVKVDATLTGIVIQIPDPATLDAMPVEEKKQLRALLGKLGGGVVEHPDIEAAG